MVQVLKVHRMVGGKRTHVRNVYSRRYRAARTIQRRFRARRAFSRRVNSAVLSRDPQQYYLRAITNQTAITQSPYSYDLTGLHYDVTGNAIPNPKYHRSSNKIKIQNLQLNFRVTAGKDTHNKVTVMLVRHKRSEPIVQADIQDTVTTPSGTETIPLLTQNDKPFLPLMNNSPTGANFNLNFGTGPTGIADTEALACFTNPKVVDVLWTKSIMVQPQYFSPGAGGTPPPTFPAGFTFQKHFSINKKLNEIWKYPQPPVNTSGNDLFPYNNKCYSIIAVSDSLSSSTSHPLLDLTMRLSFKDLD